MDDSGAPERIEVELVSNTPGDERARATARAARSIAETATSGGRDGDGDGGGDTSIDEPDWQHGDPPPRSPSAWLGTDRGRLVAVAVGVGFVGLLVGWLLGRSGGDAASSDPVADRAPVTTVERVATTGPFASLETLPEAEIEPTTTEAPRRTTTTLAEFEESRVALDERVAGLDVRLVGLRFDARLVELDLSTSTLTEREIPRTSGFESGLLVAGHDWVLVPWSNSQAMRLLRDDGTEAALDTGDQWSMLPVGGSGEFWRAGQQFGFGDPLVYELIDLAGEPVGPVVEMPWRSWAVAVDPSGGLVTTYNGSVYRVDEGGASRLAIGELVGLSDAIVVVRSCDERLRCGFEIVDRATGEVRGVPSDPELGDGLSVDVVSMWGPQRESPLSPDGGAVVVIGAFEGASQFGLVDLATGVYTPVSVGGIGGAFVWSPDGRFLFHLDQGNVSAYDRQSGEAFPLVDGQLTWTGLTARPAAGSRAEMADP